MTARLLSTVTALLLATACFATPRIALAEPVLLRTSEERGIGWLFADTRGNCRLVTPAHVITREDGVIEAPTVRDARGRQITTSNPLRVANPDIDLAFLDVNTALADTRCPYPGLATRSLSKTLTRVNTAVLHVYGEISRRTVRVQINTTAIDRYGGGIFSITPASADEAIGIGMSGGSVLHEGQPIGMLFAVDQGLGLAYRYDTIASFLDSVDAERQTDQGTRPPRFEFVLDAGQVVDGRLIDMTKADGDVTLAFASRQLRFILAMSGEQAVSGVALSTARGEMLPAGRLLVQADQGSGDFVFVRGCQIRQPVPSSQCTFAPRKAKRLQAVLIVPRQSAAKRVKLSRIQPLLGEK